MYNIYYNNDHLCLVLVPWCKAKAGKNWSKGTQTKEASKGAKAGKNRE